MLDVAPRSTTVNCLSVSYTYVPVSFSLASLFSFNLVISFFVFSPRSSSSILSQSLASSSRPNSSISASLYSWEFVSKDSLVFESRFLRCSSGPCATVTNNIQIKQTQWLSAGSRGMTNAGCLSPRVRFHCAAIPSKIAPPACKARLTMLTKQQCVKNHQHYFYHPWTVPGHFARPFSHSMLCTFGFCL